MDLFSFLVFFYIFAFLFVFLFAMNYQRKIDNKNLDEMEVNEDDYKKDS